jgi:hypothetical protein
LSGGPTPFTGNNLSLPFTIPNLATGSYTVNVTDQGSGCVSQPITNVSVAVGAGPVADYTSTPATCFFATNGTATIRATAGVAPFTFQLGTGSPQAGTSPYTFTGLSGGSHNVIVRDALGCTYSMTVNVGAGTGITATAAATSSCGGAGGTITVTPTGGTAP